MGVNPMKTTTILLATLLGLGVTALAPEAAATTCTFTPLAGGYVLVPCDTDDGGVHGFFCVTGPGLGPCRVP